MELEFDKEIDAILRKGRVGIGVSTPAAGHLDADTIAAFAENALPERARVLYTEHFADCDRCRSQLSSAVVMNREADAAAASTIWPPVEKAIPWYSKIFRTPSLALATGSLVLVFTAALGYLVLQRQGQNAANNAIVSKATEPDAGPGPYYSGEAAANTNAAPAANTAANAVAQPNAASGVTGTASNTAPSVSSTDTKAPVAEEKEAVEDRRTNGFVLDGVTTSAPAPPPPAAASRPTDQPKTERDEMLAAGDDAAKDKSGAGRPDAARSRMDREAMPEALKKVGPSRAGPLNNNQQQMNTNLGEMSVTRSVGGKTFFNRNGAWVDTMYSGQSPTLVRRGSDEFKKLDGGLRSIANELYGTVIVMWKGKAYRIV